MINAFNQTDVTFNNIYNLSSTMSKSSNASTEITTAIAQLKSYDGGNTSNTNSIINTKTISWIGVQGAINGINQLAGANGVINSLITALATISTQFNTWIPNFNMLKIISDISVYTVSANAALLQHVGTSSNLPRYVDPDAKA